jgi:ribosomal protein S18 acetylase RimI-like enzyme
MPQMLTAWTEPLLSPGLQRLVAEAADANIDWMADLPALWAAEPFIGEGEALLLVEEQGVPVAMAAIRRDTGVVDSTTGRLCFVYVTPAARRRGYAEQLVQEGLRIADRRWARLRLTTDNPAAARLYARYGFVPCAEPGATHARRRGANAQAPLTP